MRILAFVLALLPLAAAAHPPLPQSSKHPSGTTLTLADDVTLCFGDTTCDYWIVYNSGGSQWELWSTDVDGIGGNGVVASVDDGDDVADFTDAITAVGATLTGAVDIQGVLSDSSGALCIGAACDAAGTTGNVTIGGALFAVDNAAQFDGTAQFGGTVTVLDNYALKMGSGADTQLQWATGQTPHTLLWGIGSTDSNAVVVAENADLGTDFAHPLQVNPTLFWHSADATSPLQYWHLTHDQAASLFTSKTGPMTLRGALGAYTVVIDDFTQCAGATVTVTVTDSGGNTPTILTEGVEWFDTTGDNETATSLASAIDALAGVGATAATATVTLTYLDTTLDVVLAEDTAACTTVSNGTDSGVDLHGPVDVMTNGDGAYWREFHIQASKVEPAAAGATPAVINTATFVYLLNATTEYLYFGTDIHDDWDASSDMVVEVQVALSGAETADDNIQAEIIAEYVAEHGDIDTGIRTQTRSINHDIDALAGQGDVHHLVFILDHDLVSHVIQVDDNLSLRFRLDAVGGGTDVAAVWFKGANIKYRTSKPQLETGGSFPSEG